MHSSWRQPNDARAPSPPLLSIALPTKLAGGRWLQKWMQKWRQKWRSIPYQTPASSLRLLGSDGTTRRCPAQKYNQPRLKTLPKSKPKPNRMNTLYKMHGWEGTPGRKLKRCRTSPQHSSPPLPASPLHRRLEPVLLHRLHRLLIQPHPTPANPHMARIRPFSSTQIFTTTLPETLAFRASSLNCGSTSIHQHRSTHPTTNPPRPTTRIPARPRPHPRTIPRPSPVPCHSPSTSPPCAEFAIPICGKLLAIFTSFSTSRPSAPSQSSASPSAEPSAEQSAPSQTSAASPSSPESCPLCPPPPPITCAASRSHRNLRHRNLRHLLHRGSHLHPTPHQHRKQQNRSHMRQHRPTQSNPDSAAPHHPTPPSSPITTGRPATPTQPAHPQPAPSTSPRRSGAGITDLPRSTQHLVQQQHRTHRPSQDPSIVKLIAACIASNRRFNSSFAPASPSSAPFPPESPSHSHLPRRHLLNRTQHQQLPQLLRQPSDQPPQPLLLLPSESHRSQAKLPSPASASISAILRPRILLRQSIHRNPPDHPRQIRLLILHPPPGPGPVQLQKCLLHRVLRIRTSAATNTPPGT